MESSLLYRVMLQGLLQMQFVPSTADRAATESIKENRSEKKERENEERQERVQGRKGEYMSVLSAGGIPELGSIYMTSTVEQLAV